jgi:hypothetical protein
VDFGLSLLLGGRRGAEPALVSRRPLVSGAFDNLFVTAGEAATVISFEDDIGRLRKALDGVSLDAVAENKIRAKNLATGE